MAFGSIENIIADQVGREIGEFGGKIVEEHLERKHARQMAQIEAVKQDAFDRVVTNLEEWKRSAKAWREEAEDRLGNVWHQYFHRVATERTLDEIISMPAKERADLTKEKVKDLLDAHTSNVKMEFPAEAEIAENWEKSRNTKN